MKYAILPERIHGLLMYRLRIWDWQNVCILNITRHSPEGAHTALMQWQHKHGSIK